MPDEYPAGERCQYNPSEGRMDRATVTFWLGVVGSSVAVFLAVLRAHEFFRDRQPRLSAVVRFSSDSEEGNDLILLNNSRVPANIYFYDLVRAKRSFGGKNVRIGRRFLGEMIWPDQICDITILPHQQTTLSFCEEYHFRWRGDDDLYLPLSLAGRRSPLWLWICGPDRTRRRPITPLIDDPLDEA